MKEHKIGEKFKLKINGEISVYKLEKSHGYLPCNGCCFISNDGITCKVNDDRRETCIGENRSDKTEVIFTKLPK